MDDVRRWLRARGTETVDHPGGTLYAHLNRVQERLGALGHDRDVQVAGLTHAAYSTDGFDLALADHTDRGPLRALIGDRAEDLVHRYGSCERSRTWKTLPETRQVWDRWSDTPVALPDEVVTPFADLSVVNELDVLEQDPAIAARVRQLLPGPVRVLGRPAVRAGVGRGPAGAGVGSSVMNMRSIYQHGFARVAACTGHTALADPPVNAAAVLQQARRCADEGVAVAVFPELTLSGYSIEDLLLQDVLLDDVETALQTVVAGTADLLSVLVVGAPLRHRNRIYNCAVVIHRGRVLGVAPKSYLPNYREFYEKRQLAAGDDERGATIRVGGADVPFGVNLLFTAEDVPGLVLHAEICEDMWVPVPPSAEAALAGATLLVNLSGSPITVGRAEDRRLLVRSASSRCLAAYVYAAAGAGESTTDLSWDGQTMIYENGVLLAETERFPVDDRASIADIDLDLLRQERQRQGTFDDNRRTHAARTGDFQQIAFRLDPPATDLGLRRRVERFPFVPADAQRLAQDCYEAYNIQVAGLTQRLAAIGGPKVVIGVSGGLDSTHALIVAARAMDRAGRPRSDILAFTMPGFATSDHTKANAHALMRSLGVTAAELDIKPAARIMLEEMGHPFSAGEPVYDVTFENVQAGLRTDYLFRLANQRGGIVLGTGDLSELALGWCTYGVGDQMSHYNVNSGVPKTLMQHLIRWVVASGQFDAGTAATLTAILGTEISPELVPGDTPQSTESTIGPYALHDFTLFHVLRYGFRPSKIAFLAWHAWRDAAAGAWPPGFPEADRGEYDLPEIRKWLEYFCRRFFQFAQFKRSAMPNGPKVSAGGSLSPRGDWRAPSDGTAHAWLRDLARWES